MVKVTNSDPSAIGEMDILFSQGREVELPAYLESLMHYFGSSYICLWSYHPHPSNCLVFLAGFYQQHHDLQFPATGSTSSSAAAISEVAVRRHFNDYIQAAFPPLNDRVPGHAFKKRQPYVELNEPQLIGMASILPQRLFYQEARIKRAVLMGCRSGEIELGWSNLTADQQMRIESEMMKLFPEDFSRRRSMDGSGSSSSQRRHSSSSLTSPSLPSFLRNLTSTSTSAAATLSHDQLQQPQPSQVDDAITRALLAVFTSSLPHPSFTTTLPNKPNMTTCSAFYKFSSLSSSTRPGVGVQNVSMFKRALTYYRTRQRQQQQQQHMTNVGPSTTQLHHMISERRRREKINHSFQALRSLLPPHPKILA